MKKIVLALALIGCAVIHCVAQTAATSARPAKTKAVARSKKKRKPRPITTVVLTAADAAKGPTRLGIGDTLVLALDENPSTGYQWAVTEAPAATKLRAVGDTFAYPVTEQPMVGGGGTRRFRYVALAAGAAQVALHYRRPWEQQESGRRLTVRVTIR